MDLVPRSRTSIAEKLLDCGSVNGSTADAIWYVVFYIFIYIFCVLIYYFIFTFSVRSFRILEKTSKVKHPLLWLSFIVLSKTFEKLV